MIPNIVKGTGITGAIRYALGEGYDGLKQNGREYVLDRMAGINVKGKAVELADGEEGRASVIGGQNFGFDIDSFERVELARKAMEWNALPQNQTSRTLKCENDCLHATLSWEKGQAPTAEDMRHAAQSFLKGLGMDTALAVFIAHDDKDHSHVHIIASRIDPDTGRTYSQQNDFAYAQAWALQYEREQGLKSQSPARQMAHMIVDAIELRDGGKVADLLTRNNPTFTARELDKSLMLATMTPDDRAKFRGDILGSKEVFGLRETADAGVTRYTTAKVLADELTVLHGADKLAADTGHGVARKDVMAAAKKFTLIDEQAEALSNLTDRKGIGILWGEAGTGKSHTLKAVREVYEDAGFNVVGLSHTNKVVQLMHGDGFANANTITSELNALEKGATNWNRKTVVVVDEAAMVATEALGRIVTAAQKSGAKLILAGDDAQLSSIERGGMFETLREKHGAAILDQVQRVKDADQKKAFNEMHSHKFRGALDTIAKAGNIHISEKQDEALQQTAKAYTEDHAADPSKRRMMFAATNAEVDALNSYAREMHQKRGDLGADKKLMTAHGEQVFAVGERIIFTGNGYGQKQKNAGFTNANTATITAIDAARVTVALDVGKGEKPRSLSFIVGENSKAGEFNRFKTGYAGTIYKGQAATLDQTYVCHSPQWRAQGSYVALTRHRETVKVFVSRETITIMKKVPHNQKAAAFDLVEALDVMANGMARKENRRSASAYFIDKALSLGVDLRQLAKVATAGKPQQAYERVAAHLEIARLDQRRKSALNVLAQLFGREVNRDEGERIARDRGRSL